MKSGGLLSRAVATGSHPLRNVMKNRGFTLIELIVAVFITSIVVIAAYGLMTGSSRNFYDQNDRRVLESNLRNAELILQRDFSRIGYHAPFGKTGATDRVSVCVSSGSVQFNALHVTYSNATQSSVNFLADLTDYDGFTVKTYTDGKITFENGMQLPLAAVDFGTADDEPARKFVADNGFDAVFDRAFRYAHAAYIISPENKGIFTKWNYSDNSINPCGTLTTFGFSATDTFVGDSVFPVLMVNYHLDNGKLMRCYGDPFDSTKSYDSDTCEILIQNVKMFKVFAITDAHPVVKCDDIPGDENNPLDIDLKDVIGLGFCLSAASENIASTPDGTANSVNGAFWYDSDGKGHAFGQAYGTSMIKNRNAEWASISTDINLNAAVSGSP